MSFCSLGLPCCLVSVSGLLKPDLIYKINNKSGVAGAVLQSPLSIINYLTNLPISSQSSKRHNSQTVRARDLKCWHNVCHSLCVTCPVSGVRCHMSRVTSHYPTVRARELKFLENFHFLPPVPCNVSYVTCPMSLNFWAKWGQLVGWGSVINGASPFSLNKYSVMDAAVMWWQRKWNGGVAVSFSLIKDKVRVKKNQNISNDQSAKLEKNGVGRGDGGMVIII